MLISTGCAPRPATTIDVQRRSMHPGQNVPNFQMETHWAWFSASADGWYRILLSFPLPGSEIGRPNYALFARFRPADGPHRFSTSQSEQAQFVRLSRTQGKLDEMWMVTQGHMTTRWQDNGRWLAGEFDLTCGQELHLVGQFTTLGSDLQVARFEQGYLKSVGGTAGATTQPATTRPDRPIRRPPSNATRPG